MPKQPPMMEFRTVPFRCKCLMHPETGVKRTKTETPYGWVCNSCHRILKDDDEPKRKQRP